MELPPFLLDQWLTAYEFADPPIAFNLAASTGPRLAVAELLALGGNCDIDGVALSYSPPEGDAGLRRAIGDFLGVDPDWVVATTGASEALSILFCLAAGPGTEILLPDPQFAAFGAMANAWGARAVGYRLRREERFAQRAASILAAVGPRCALALVNTPHNPTGAVMEPAELAALADALGARGVPLVVDEVYHPLYFGAPALSAAAVGNAIVVGDLSKALCLPGLRTGWIVDSNRARRARIVNARSYFTVSGSPLLEALAAHALRNSAAILDRLQRVAGANLAALSGFMSRSGDLLDWVAPAGGPVAFPWFRDGRDARPFCEAAATAGVLIAPGDCFDAPSHIRIGFGAQASGYDEALSILSHVLRSY